MQHSAVVTGFAACSLLLAAATSALDLDWVPVGSPGNACDVQPQGCFGAVDETYLIGKYEVTTSQYVEFLNAVDPEAVNHLRLIGYATGFIPEVEVSLRLDHPPGLRWVTNPGMALRPAVRLGNWYAILRFANWLHNGGGPGADTESGAYTLEGGTPRPTNWETLARQPDALVFVPSEDEWFKAAYYDTAAASYLPYPFADGMAPLCEEPQGGAHSANCGDVIGEPVDVGSFPLAIGPNGTFDQAGNVFEALETQTHPDHLTVRVARGGSFVGPPEDSAASMRFGLAQNNSQGRTLGFRLASHLVFFDWVTVNHRGNAPDTTGFGAVADPFRISATEVTNAQYVRFLNAVADDDPNGLYDADMGLAPNAAIHRVGDPGTFTYTLEPGSEGDPVRFVDFYDAIRFVNWLHNGQLRGAQDDTTTEGGAYTITASGIATNSTTRNPGATFFLPSEDEWYKAAYHDALTPDGYFSHPAGTSAPTSCATPGATVNTANCANVVGSPVDVGSYAGSPSPYGTFDQGGNVWEWNETIIEGTMRGLRGAGYLDPAGDLAASSRGMADPAATADADVGFRVARLASQCDDGLDNDGDGLIDGADVGCATLGDEDERAPFLPCDDGVDNDADGRIDFDPVTAASRGSVAEDPAGLGDPACRTPDGITESPQCQDGIDNDVDGTIDYDGGRSIHGTAQAAPDPECRHPWTRYEWNVLTDLRCGLGFELVFLLPPYLWLRRRRPRT